MNLKNYLKSIEKTFGLFADDKVKKNEADRISVSDLFWASKKTAPFHNRKIKKGDVLQFDFGKNLEPEMSYEHRGLVIGSSGQLLYVLPIFSYVEEKHKHQLYHPATKPKGHLMLLSSSEYGFIKHDSILKLNDIRTVSTKRILYRQDSGHIDIQSDTFKCIETLVLAKYFPDVYHKLLTMEAL